MTSRPLPAISLLTAALLSLATTVFGETAEATPAERLLATLKERYPATPFTRVQNTPVPGLYEVVFGNNIAYAADDGRHFLFGHLFDLQTQRDLTAANAPPTTPPSAATPVAFAALPLADAIKTVRGDGRRVLAVFSDPDCPYCRELEAQLAALDDATVYTFLLPLAALHPQATDKAIAVWCAADRARAWRALMLEGQPPPAKTCAHPLERNRALATQLAVRGTPTLIAGDGRVAVGVLSAAELAAWLDARSETAAAATVTEDGR
ncbi:MAG: DsbC family protein [Betaproteobacteria bacterium]|nr:DsbC family protein [Betaproteobacteria bacterium]